MNDPWTKLPRKYRGWSPRKVTALFVNGGGGERGGTLNGGGKTNKKDKSESKKLPQVQPNGGCKDQNGVPARSLQKG